MNPFLDEIHDFREKNAAKFNNDLDLAVKTLKGKLETNPDGSHSIAKQ